MRTDKNTEAFWALLRAGLWETVNENDNQNHNLYDSVDWSEVQRLAEEQSVVGLVAAGIDVCKTQVSDFKIAKADALQFIGQTLQLEQRNSAMNYFIGVLVDKMRDAGIYTLLVKGQGIAQCYAKPLWRSCGDVDFFLSDTNYEKAKAYLIPLASSVEPEGKYKQHLGMTIDPWVVELHGSLRFGLSKRMDKGLDMIQDDVFHRGSVRSWMNGNTQVFMLDANNDVVYVFAHILNHFYKGGIGVRQICDWCRLLWTYRETLDQKIIESRIRQMGIMTEWKAFGAFAVFYLGLPITAYRLLFGDEKELKKHQKKAKRICDFILEVGNFGHNRDMSYYSQYPFVIRKAISFGQRVGDICRHARIFPLDSLRFFPTIVLNGLRSAADGE